jgi:hypothetical protein
MNNYEEIKKLLSASRKMINESNSQLQEDIKHIKNVHQLITEEDNDVTTKIDVGKSIEKNIDQDTNQTPRDKQQSYRVSGGLITLHGKDKMDIQLTTEEKTFFQDTMNEFVDEVSNLSDFGVLNVYENSVEWSGNIIEFDLTFFYTIGEENGVYIDAETMKLDPQSLELLEKLSSFYEKFKSKWAGVLANRKKTKKVEK